MKYLPVAILATLAHLSLQAQTRIKDWTITTGTIEEKEFLGRKALFLTRGLAYLTNSQFTNGVIEADIATSLMGGLSFRIDEKLNYEEAYIRVPKSGLPDALQFGSVFNGEFSWQFYPEYQARVVYPKDQWIHMKIIVEDDKAGIYLNNRDTAVLYIDSLRSGNRSGHVGIWALNGAYFSEFKSRPATAREKLPAIPKKLLRNPDAIKKWWVSEPAVFTQAPSDKLPTFPSTAKWTQAVTDPDGYLNINKYAKKNTWGRSRENSHDIVWIRHEWQENSDGLKPFSFEYSNLCYVFINENKMFAGNNSFLLKGPLYRGDIDKQMRGNTIFLPVKKGTNSLVVAVSGIANGWGFMGQFADGTTKKFGAF